MWEVISQNPKFQEAFGGYMTEELYNQMPQDAKDNIARTYGSAGVPSPVLDIKPMEISPATNPSNQNPVLNTQPNPYFPPNEEAPAAAPVPTGYEDYSVQDFINAGNNLNTNPVLSGDMNRGVEPVAPIMQDPQRSDAYLGTLSKEKLRELADAGNVQAAALLQANIPDPVAPPVVDPAQPAAPALAPRVVPDVDYSDPTLAPLPQPVLVDTTQPKTETTTTESEPVLKSGGQGRSTGALSAGSITSSSGPKTSNARGSQMPQMLVDRNEALIRIGGAMYSGALKGDGIGAATTEYGRIQDANREQARKMAEAEQKRQLEMAKLRAKGAGGGKGGKKDRELLTSTNEAMSNYQDALTAIRESRAAGGNLTGVGGIAKSLFDNFTGDADAARRLILQRVKVDDALLRVAETKGAISNAEMKLFLAPAPSNLQDEAIWEQWLLDRMEALQRVQQRLSQGGTVPVNQRPTNQTFNPADYTVEQVSE
jgi:hypothetical protein